MKEIKRLRFITRCFSCFFIIILFLTAPIGLYNLAVNITLGVLLLFLAGFSIIFIKTLSKYHLFLQEEIVNITNKPSDALRYSAVKMKFSSFLNICKSIPNQCVLDNDSAYFCVPNAKRKTFWTYADDRLYVYFNFWNYLKYSQYLKRIKQEDVRKKEAKELEECLDVIESLKAEVKKSKNKADDEMVDAYNNFIQKARAYTDSADVDDWDLFKGLTLEVKQNYDK